MFDIGAAELLLVAIVALVVIGPKDLPAALRGVGRVLGQLRSFTNQFRFSLDSMIREAEMEGQEKEWAEKNADIMAKHPPGEDVSEFSEEDRNQPGERGSPAGERHDDEMKPLKQIATDDAGEISSREEPPAPQSSVEPASEEDENSSQIDMFGGKS